MMGVNNIDIESEIDIAKAEISALKECIAELVKQKNKASAKLENIQEIIEMRSSGSFTSVMRKIDAINEELLK